MTFASSPSHELAEAIKARLGNASIVFVVSDAPGKAAVSTFSISSSRAELTRLASAVAAVKTVAGWDETVPIVVTVAGVAVSVEMLRESETWVAVSHIGTAA